MSRPAAMLLTALLVSLLLGLDALRSRPPDPFAAPAPLALWSGEAATGGFCGAPAR